MISPEFSELQPFKEFPYKWMQERDTLMQFKLHTHAISRFVLNPISSCKIPILVVIFMMANRYHAQQFSITESNVSSCEGTLFDTGSDTSDYQANEDYTTTICAVSPEVLVNVYWRKFNLGSGDFMEIYDGPTTASPLIGTYHETDLFQQYITSSNAGGCLTLHFVSDNASHGNFEAALSCGQPCSHPAPEMTIALNEVYQACQGENAHVDSYTLTGGKEPYSYTWTSEDGEQFNSEEIVIPVGLQKQYCLTVLDFCGSTTSACTIVKSYPNLAATFEMNIYEGCEPISVLMTSETLEFQDIDQMTWHFGDGDSSNTLASANHEYTVDGIYHPWMQIIDIHGCITADTFDYPVRVFPRPQAAFTVNEDYTYLPNTTFRFTNESIDGDDYFWTFDEFGTSDLIDTSFTFPLGEKGNYDIELFVTNLYGCADIASHSVSVKEEIDLYIPNSFTPDGDGVNDVWQIRGSGFDALAIKTEIYNRSGERIFESTDPTEVWTGSHAGSSNFVQDGMYFYKILVRDQQFEVGHLYEGHITLLR